MWHTYNAHIKTLYLSTQGAEVYLPFVCASYVKMRAECLLRGDLVLNWGNHNRQQTLNPFYQVKKQPGDILFDSLAAPHTSKPAG